MVQFKFIIIKFWQNKFYSFQNEENPQFIYEGWMWQ
jgi:hypothetical protein